MESLFGVVNVPNVVWIDEEGMIVRPPEPGWPNASTPRGPDTGSRPKLGRAKNAPVPHGDPPDLRTLIGSGQDRETYPDAIRDWVKKGAHSAYALTPDDVVARSQPRSVRASEGAAHFELGNHLWQAGQRDLAIAHFNQSHRLQPDNWAYKRQAWSLLGNERIGGEFGRFAQAPVEGEEDDWPFDSDFRSDVSLLGPGEYYPKTL